MWQKIRGLLGHPILWIGLILIVVAWALWD
jgi:hypothetical protein